MFGRKRVLGIDIGSIETKLISLKARGKKYEIVDYISIDTPVGAMENELIIQAELLGEKLGQVIRQHNIKTKNVITAVSGSQVYIKNLIMPQMGLEELRQAVYYKAITFLPIPVEETVMDIFPTGNFSTEKGAKVDLFFTAVRRQQIELLETCFEIAGLNLMVIDLEPLALNRILANPHRLRTRALLYLGATSSGFYIFEGGKLLLHRPISIGYTDIDTNEEAKLNHFKQEILMEINRSLEYQSLQFKPYPEAILICGYGSKSSEVLELLGGETEPVVQLGEINPDIINLKNISASALDLLEQEYLVALGLAIRGGA